MYVNEEYKYKRIQDNAKKLVYRHLHEVSRSEQ